MTIQEAIRSGKRFKRSEFSTYQTAVFWLETSALNPEDILAIDWEVEEYKVEITEVQINKMFKDYWRSSLNQYEVIEKLMKGGYK